MESVDKKIRTKLLANLRYLHSNEASFTFLITYSHIIRSIILQSYIYLFNTWITGIILYLILIIYTINPD